MAPYRGWIRGLWLKDGERLDVHKRGGEERYGIIRVGILLMQQLVGPAQGPQDLADRVTPLFQQGTGMPDLEVLGWESDVLRADMKFLVYAPSLAIVPEHVMVPDIPCVLPESQEVGT